jgi:hypothetical protein
MMAVHVLPGTDDDGSVSLAYHLASGRASALFAVLAGVGLALATGARVPPSGARLRSARAGVLGRALVVAAVGLTLGGLDTPVAVILVHYGLLFCCALPFLGLRARPLAALAAGWLLLSPVLGHVLRGELPPGPGDNPSWAGLGEPGTLLLQVVVTGYYPVLQWTGYLLVGLAVGRSDLRRTDVQVGLATVGVVLAAGAKAVSAYLLGPLGGYAHLAQSVPPTSPIASVPLDVALQTSLYGTTPTTSWWWLAVSGPHSGAPLDLVHTTGTALVVLAVCLLLAGRWRTPVLPLAAAGSLTLTLYTLHVAALGPLAGPSAEWPDGVRLAVHVAVAVVAATAWRATVDRRGPLEAVAAGSSRALARAAGGLSRAG